MNRNRSLANDSMSKKILDLLEINPLIPKMQQKFKILIFQFLSHLKVHLFENSDIRDLRF